MKKMKRYALLLAGLMLLSLAGCGTAQTPSTAKDNPPFADTPADVPSATEISDDITAEESALPAAEPERPAITEPVPSQTAEETAAKTPPIENTAAPPPAQSEQPRKAQPPWQAEMPKHEEPKPKPPQPVQPQTSAPKEPSPAEPEPSVEPPQESAESKPEFNIDDWISLAKIYAVSVGLRLESSAVDCWDNPITAGAHSSCLQRDIESRLNRYSRDEDITDVWIWAQERPDGSYDLYIGYA